MSMDNGHRQELQNAQETRDNLQQNTSRKRIGDKLRPNDPTKYWDGLTDYASRTGQRTREVPGRMWAKAGGADYDAIKKLDERIQKHEDASRLERENFANSLQKLDSEIKRLREKAIAHANEGATLYKDFHAWNLYDNKAIDATTQKKRDEEDEATQQINETIGWSYRTWLEDMDASRITSWNEFHEAKRLALQEGIAKSDEIKAVYKHTEKLELLSQGTAAKQRVEKTREYYEYILNKLGTSWLTKIVKAGLKNSPFSPAKPLEEYREQASQRAKELTRISKAGKERQAIFKKHIEKAGQRLTKEQERFDEAKAQHEKVSKYEGTEHDKRLKIFEDYKKMHHFKISG